MQIRKAIPADADAIMHIFRQAQAGLRIQGINQWQNGYPNMDIVDSDIASGKSLVCVENSRIASVFVLAFELEETYERIYCGQWESAGQSGVIHRMAVEDSFKGRGLGREMISKAQQISLDFGIHSIKVDTHRDNGPMQGLLLNNHFLYCGVIYLADGQERLAYEKLF